MLVHWYHPADFEADGDIEIIAIGKLHSIHIEGAVVGGESLIEVKAEEEIGKPCIAEVLITDELIACKARSFSVIELSVFALEWRQIGIPAFDPGAVLEKIDPEFHHQARVGVGAEYWENLSHIEACGKAPLLHQHLYKFIFIAQHLIAHGKSQFLKTGVGIIDIVAEEVVEVGPQQYVFLGLVGEGESHRGKRAVQLGHIATGYVASTLKLKKRHG